MLQILIVINVLLILTQLIEQQHEHHAVQVQQVELVPLHDILFEEMV